MSRRILTLIIYKLSPKATFFTPLGAKRRNVLAVAQWRLYLCARLIISRHSWIICLVYWLPGLFSSLLTSSRVWFSPYRGAHRLFPNTLYKVWRNANIHSEEKITQLHQWSAERENTRAGTFGFDNPKHACNEPTHFTSLVAKVSLLSVFLFMSRLEICFNIGHKSRHNGRATNKKQNLSERRGGDRRPKEIKAIALDFLKCGSAQKRAFENIKTSVNSKAATNKWWAFLWVFRSVIYVGRPQFVNGSVSVCLLRERKIHTPGLCLFYGNWFEPR